MRTDSPLIKLCTPVKVRTFEVMLLIPASLPTTALFSADTCVFGITTRAEYVVVTPD